MLCISHNLGRHSRCLSTKPTLATPQNHARISIFIKKGKPVFPILFFSILLTSTQLTDTPKSQMVSFPDRVKKTPLQVSEAIEQSKLTQALQELEKDNTNFSISNPALFATTFKTQIHPKSINQIKIPKSGSFDLLLQEGSQFKITDKDATDGLTTIEIPSGTLKPYFHVTNQHHSSSQLDIQDPLYHVKDSLTFRHWNRWFTPGKRPLPIPTDWRSPDSKNLRLKMTTKEIEHFYMLWLKTSTPAPLPPGIKEIGPEGGIIELPGVSKITIGKNAVAVPTIFTVRQLNQFPQLHTLGISLRRSVHIGPAVKIEPKMELNNQYISAINIEINSEIKSRIDPVSVSYLNFYDENKYYSLGQLVQKNNYPIYDNYFNLTKTGVIIPAVNRVLLSE